ncbi:MAG: twin-arginine translocase TatA/TatE family subunit [Anaerolineales bacterium]
MPFRLGTPELIILLVIVLLLFGVGRIGRIATELGRGIRDFRRGLTEEEKADENETADETAKTRKA